MKKELKSTRVGHAGIWQRAFSYKELKLLKTLRLELPVQEIVIRAVGWGRGSKRE